MNALGICILCIVVLAVLFTPRRWALIGIMAGVLYLTQGQAVEVLGFRLWGLRFVELAGFIRVSARREFSLSAFNRLDRIFLLVYSYTTLIFLLRSDDGQAYQIGLAVDAFLCYFVFRALIWNVEELRWFLLAFLFLLAPYVALVLDESFTTHNPFTAMGGVVLSGPEWYREGRLRVQSSFRHPSLLGTLGASFLPLYIGLWFRRNHRMLASIGVGLCLTIVWASNSGGPASSALAGLVGWMLWSIRRRMQVVRRALVATIVVLALAMKAPVWYLPAKFSSLTGGDGWHRSHLMEMAFQNLDKWWFIGMPVRDTAVWFPYVLEITGGADMTNGILVFGITAGLAAMILFVAVLVLGFSNLGSSLAVLRSTNASTKESECLYWGLGVALAVHIVNWFGISYFDQIYVIWFMQLATISSLTEVVMRTNSVSGVGRNTDAMTISGFPVACKVGRTTFGTERKEEVAPTDR